MESILMKIPVICSNVTSLPETIGNLKYVFDPSNIYDMANKIREICFNEEYRSTNIQNSITQSERLRNTNAELKLNEIINKLDIC
jgi:glycosyltransferase involved in cell wall biosynthesis